MLTTNFPPVVVIQARVASTRLASKVVRPFHKQSSLLELLIERIARSVPDCTLIVATSNSPGDDAIAAIASNFNMPCCRGEQDDVLARFLHVADEYSLPGMVRVCSDNPFLQPSSIHDLQAAACDSDIDYVGYFMPDGTPSIRTHLGLFPEYVSVNALRRVASLNLPVTYTQHVTNYVYEHSDEFNITRLLLPNSIVEREDVRLTVDTPDDFLIAQQLYSAVLKRDHDLSWPAIISCVDERPDWLAVMRRQIEKNAK